MDKRIWALALLGTLMIRLLAWGAAADGAVHAGHLNQTIPTPTPTGLPGTPPTSEPTEPVPTVGPTEPLPTAGPTVPSAEPSSTPVPSPSAVPSATQTDQPPGDTATAAATEAPPASAPTGSVEVPVVTGTATPISTPPAGSPTLVPEIPASLTPTDTPRPSAEDTGVPALPTVAPTWTSVTSVTTDSTARSVFSNTSCLWIGVGFVLVLLGILLLVLWRRSV